MGMYRCGPSVLRLTGRVAAVVPGDWFEHDFSARGPDGVDGPAREAALLASGAFTLAPGQIAEATRLAAARAAEVAATEAARLARDTALLDTTEATPIRGPLADTTNEVKE